MRKNRAIREVDSLGRIVIPIELRRALQIDSKSLVEVYIDNDRLIIKKHSPACVFCGSEDNITQFSDKALCRQCLAKIKSI